MKKYNVLIFYRLQRLFLFLSWRHDLSMFCLVLLWLLQASYPRIMMNGRVMAALLRIAGGVMLAQGKKTKPCHDVATWQAEWRLVADRA